MLSIKKVELGIGTGQLSVSIMWLGGISCQSVWGMIFQWGSTLKVSIELPVTSRHRRDMTERLLKATLSPNQTNNQKTATCSQIRVKFGAENIHILNVQCIVTLLAQQTCRAVQEVVSQGTVFPTRLHVCLSKDSDQPVHPCRLIKVFFTDPARI